MPIYMENQDQKSHKGIVLASILVAIVVIGLFTNGYGLLTGKTISDQSILKIGDSPVLGDLKAPVTIYEFTDFSCPFCAAADNYNQEVIDYLKKQDSTWQAPIPKIEENYVKTGKVKIVFKYYPGHGAGMAAQAVGLALNEQGLFWKFYDAAFENQQDTGDITKMKDLAKSLGADMDKLNTFLNAKKYESTLNDDIAMAKAAGIKGTPTFVINGQVIKGAESYSEFAKVIDQELAKSK
jgi:protein-disulfide isomerase